MFIAQVSIKSDENEDANEIVLERFNTLLSMWRSHGQVLGNEFPTVITGDLYRAFLMVPQHDALEASHDSEYSRWGREKLEELTTLTIEILGEEAESAEPCDCKRSSFFVLYTSYVKLESSLRCGDCFGPIPLYILPKQQMERGELHDQIMSWQSDYQACDTLQMNCSTGEKFGLREMSQLHSSLTKRGREICDAIFAATKTPTYYYLHRYYGRSDKFERSRKCPSCHCEWLPEEKLHDLFDFKCDKCRLLSNVAFV